MATTLSSKLSYQRLKHQVEFDNDDNKVIKRFITRSPRKWLINKLKRIRIRRILRINFGRIRKRFKIRSRVKVARLSWGRLCKRLNESQSHFGDLFAGNYLFMQVTPTSLKKNNKVNHISPSFVGPNYKFNPPRLPLGFNNYGTNTNNNNRNVV